MTNFEKVTASPVSEVAVVGRLPPLGAVRRAEVFVEDHFTVSVGRLASLQFRIHRTQANVQCGGYFDRRGVLTPHPFKLLSVLQRQHFHLESPLFTVSMPDWVKK